MLISSVVTATVFYYTGCKQHRDIIHTCWHAYRQRLFGIQNISFWCSIFLTTALLSPTLTDVSRQLSQLFNLQVWFIQAQIWLKTTWFTNVQELSNLEL